MKKRQRFRYIFTKPFWKYLLGRTRLSLYGIRGVMSKWQYSILGFIITILFATFFSILSVGTTEWHLIVSSLPFIDKLGIVIESLARFIREIPTLTGSLTFIIALLQGLTITLLIFNIRQQIESKKIYGNTKNRLRESVLASVIATLGLGCPTCGVSLLVPLLSILSSPVIFISTMTTIITIAAILLLLYASWNMGYTAYIYITAKKPIEDFMTIKEKNNEQI